MALARVTLIDQIEVQATGDLLVRLKLLIVEDGTKVVSHKFHRFPVEFGVDHVAQVALVNTHLASMGEAPVSASDIARLGAFCDVDKATPERINLGRALLKKPAEPPVGGPR